MPASFKKMTLEEVLVGLQEVAASDTRYTSKAQGLLGWYRQKGDFTKAQVAFGANIIQQCRRKLQKSLRPKSYYLYAIDDGVNIKLGFSSNLNSRLRDMQVGQATKLEVVWRLYVSDVQAQAMKAERQLHRYCKRYHKRGEWFNRDCMVLVRQFELKRTIEQERKEEVVELAIVSDARERLG